MNQNNQDALNHLAATLDKFERYNAVTEQKLLQLYEANEKLSSRVTELEQKLKELTDPMIKIEIEQDAEAIKRCFEQKCRG